MEFVQANPPPLPPLHRQATNLGLLLHRTETAEHPCVPCFYFTLKGDPPLVDVQRRVLEALCKFHRWRSVLVGGTFVDDRTSFDIEEHVREISQEEFGAPLNMDGLKAYLERRFTAPLDPSRPMWSFDLVRGFAFGTVVIARVHHVIVDGTAGTLMLGAMSDEAQAGCLVKMSKEEIERKIGEVKARSLGGCGPVGLCVGAGRVLCRYAADLLRAEPPSPFRGNTGIGRSIAWAAVDAHASIGAARARGCTFNDLWMSCLCFAMGEYMRARGWPTEKVHLTAGLPVSLHSPILPPEVGNEVGNRFGFLVVQLPLGKFDGAGSGREERLQAVHETLMAAKRTPEPLVSHSLVHCAGCLPEPVVHCALRRAGNARTSVILSNVRGPPDALHIGGMALGELFGFLPTPAGVGLGVGIGTYAGSAALSITCDRALLGDGANELLASMLAEHAMYCAPPTE